MTTTNTSDRAAGPDFADGGRRGSRQAFGPDRAAASRPLRLVARLVLAERLADLGHERK